MVCVDQAFCLMFLSYRGAKVKSTARNEPSQFVYKNGNYMDFRLQNVQNISWFCTLTTREQRGII